MRYLVPAAPNELQLDIDSKKLPEIYPAIIEVLDRRIGIKKIERFRSRSGFLHIIVTLKRKLPKWERIIWQLALGSDPFRELHNLERIISGKSKHPIFLAMKKPRNGNFACNCHLPKGIPTHATRCDHVLIFQPNERYRRSE